MYYLGEIAACASTHGHAHTLTCSLLNLNLLPGMDDGDVLKALTKVGPHVLHATVCTGCLCVKSSDFSAHWLY